MVSFDKAESVSNFDAILNFYEFFRNFIGKWFEYFEIIWAAKKRHFWFELSEFQEFSF